VAHSDDYGQHFTPAIQLAQHGKSMDTGGDARPQIMETVPGHLLVSYDFFRDDKWNAQINLVDSNDGGKTFGVPRPLIEGGVSERFPSWLKDEQGRILMAWIDKRLANHVTPGSREDAVSASVFYAWSNDGGQHFASEISANASSCECCRIAASLDEKGQAVISYRGNFPEGIRDHAVQWVPFEGNPKPAQKISDDYWKTKSCPHQGPTLAVTEAGTLHAAWFTQGSRRKGVFYSHSADHGQTWSIPVPLGQAPHVISRPYVVAVQNGLWMVWKEFDGDKTRLMLMRSADDGQHWNTPQNLLETTGYSDHPLLVQQKGKVYLSWLTRKEGYHFLWLP
jgi:hypothetical protein